MQKLLLAAAAALSLGLGAGSAFAQAPDSAQADAAAPASQAQNFTSSQQDFAPNQWTAPRRFDGTRRPRLWKNGIPWSDSNPYSYDVAGG